MSWRAFLAIVLGGLAIVIAASLVPQRVVAAVTPADMPEPETCITLATAKRELPLILAAYGTVGHALEAHHPDGGVELLIIAFGLPALHLLFVDGCLVTAQSRPP